MTIGRDVNDLVVTSEFQNCSQIATYPPQQSQANLRTTSNNQYKDQELFGQHMLKSRKEINSIDLEDVFESEHQIDHGVNMTSDCCSGNENNGDSCDIEEFDDDSSEAALIAVASAEEYAAKIIKLQQACLIPLKEDLADWLNKVLKTSQITTDNFMDKLDNGVIICRLAKVISLWCKQKLDGDQDSNATSSGGDKVPNVENAHGPGRPSSRSHFHDNNRAIFNLNGPFKASSTSQSTNCLIKTSASATSLNNGSHLSYHSNQFLNNLIRMHHIKIWEDARSRTFYARDNVCNFVKWCRDFGVNRSVLFESDDLVLHANPRQVVLCLLDVARIAYVKYGFTEAPGLVKFEQEIDRELASEQYNSVGRGAFGVALEQQQQHKSIRDNLYDRPFLGTREVSNKRAPVASSHSRTSIGDATDELIMRYCRHKEEEAERKRRQEEEIALQQQRALELFVESTDLSVVANDKEEVDHLADQFDHKTLEPDSLMHIYDDNHTANDVTSSTDLKLPEINGKIFMADHGRVESLDSGEGPTESASTAYSSGRSHGGPSIVTSMTDDADSQVSTPGHVTKDNPSPTPASQLTTTSNSATENSEMSSSRSSLLSNQDGNNSTSNHYGRQITSDLDGKVMRIAKSYYGKKATKDITRLSEGKYKIADRIVFVRLLKGHRVMVRIGGGWDTLENFLFRHKSDPTQVIDPDNLLPLETKVSLEKSSHGTPKGTPIRSPGASRLPNYRRSNSASSTNLSLSNLSFSNISLSSSHNTYSRHIPEATMSNSIVSSKYDSSPTVDQTPKRQIPCLLIHKGQPVNRSPRHYNAASYNMMLAKNDIRNRSNSDQQQHIPQMSSAQATTTTTTTTMTPDRSLLKKPHNYSINNRTTPVQRRKATTPYHSANKSIHLSRPLASSKAPAFSVTNLYPATLTTNSNRSRI